MMCRCYFALFSRRCFAAAMHACRATLPPLFSPLLHYAIRLPLPRAMMSCHAATPLHAAPDIYGAQRSLSLPTLRVCCRACLRRAARANGVVLPRARLFASAEWRAYDDSAANANGSERDDDSCSTGRHALPRNDEHMRRVCQRCGASAEFVPRLIIRACYAMLLRVAAREMRHGATQYASQRTR